MLQPPPPSTLFPYTTLFRSLTFRDEYLDLADKERSDTAKKLARNSYLIEEFLVNEWEKGNIRDRKSTRLNSSHVAISYAVFCLKKKNNGKSKCTPTKMRR